MRAKTMNKPTQKTSGASVDLRRWCIEHAMRWPISTVRQPSNQALGGFGQTIGSYESQVDQDVIARAEKLLQWVTK